MSWRWQNGTHPHDGQCEAAAEAKRRSKPAEQHGVDSSRAVLLRAPLTAGFSLSLLLPSVSVGSSSGSKHTSSSSSPPPFRSSFPRASAR
jgi:hypothetical protein